MKKYVFRILAAMFCLLLHSQAISLPTAAADDEATLTIGSQAPDIDIETWVSDRDGKFAHVPKLKSDKIYVIAFWATWCGPCVGDQPHLQEAWERFGGDNFRIVSVSFDVSWADVERFRKERYAMPWDHTYLTGKDSDEAWQMFDIDGIPRVVLVDPEGRIVRVDHGLRGAGLVKTLAEIIGE